MSATNTLRTFLLNPEQLLANRMRLATGAPALRPAYDMLLAQANDLLNCEPFSVMNKSRVPPSGDMHDYYSQGPYWWPNPETDDGLPYVRRDGERNPEFKQFDPPQRMAMEQAVETLAVAWFFSEEENYASKAVELLRAWFLDEATRMNPHLEYGQSIPGICDGRGIGIIETRMLSRVVDAIGLLAGSRACNGDVERGLSGWFRQYLHWLLTSKTGRDEGMERNNHGTWYDVQIGSFALFTDDKRTARIALAQNAPRRITSNVDPDGSQPRELARTRTLSYSTMNLLALTDLAMLGQHVAVNLWHHEMGDGQGIRQALDYLISNAIDQQWPHQQIDDVDYTELLPILYRAAVAYNDNSYREAIQRLPIEDAVAHRAHLLNA